MSDIDQHALMSGIKTAAIPLSLKLTMSFQPPRRLVRPTCLDFQAERAGHKSKITQVDLLSAAPVQVSLIRKLLL